MKVAGRVDPIPNIRTAGRVIAMGGESVDVCLKSNGFA